MFNKNKRKGSSESIDTLVSDDENNQDSNDENNQDSREQKLFNALNRSMKLNEILRNDMNILKNEWNKEHKLMLNQLDTVKKKLNEVMDENELLNSKLVTSNDKLKSLNNEIYGDTFNKKGINHKLQDMIKKVNNNKSSIAETNTVVKILLNKKTFRRIHLLDDKNTDSFNADALLRFLNMFKQGFGQQFSILLGNSEFFLHDDEKQWKSIVDGYLKSGAELKKNDSNYISKFVAEEIIDSLTKDVDIIWIQGGGQPGSKLNDSMEYMKKLLTHLNNIIKNNPDKIKEIRIKPQKIMIGYCYVSVIILFLSAKGLVRGIHAPMPTDIIFNYDVWKNNGIDIRIKNLLTFNETPHMYSLSPLNKSAEEFAKNGKIITATVIGGLMKSIYEIIKICLSLKSSNKQQAKFLFENKFIIFFEFLDFKDRKYIGEMLEIITKKELLVAAVCFGSAIPLNKEDANFLKEMAECKKSFGEKLDKLGIPVSDNLKVGHIRDNFPLPYGLAEITLDKNKGMLKLESKINQKKDLLTKYNFWEKEVQVKEENKNLNENKSDKTKLNNCKIM